MDAINLQGVWPNYPGPVGAGGGGSAPGRTGRGHATGPNKKLDHLADDVARRDAVVLALLSDELTDD